VSKAEQDIIKIMFAYTQQERNTVITFGKLIGLIKGYAQKFYKEKNSLIFLLNDTESVLANELKDLEANNHVVLRKNSTGEIISVNYTGFFRTSIQWWYRKMSSDIETPFPRHKHIELPIPSNQIKNIKIDQEFLENFHQYESYQGILEIEFDHSLNEILVTTDIFCKKLELISLQKLGNYLGKRKNLIYLYQTLQLSEEETIRTKKTIETLESNPREELQRIQNPSKKTLMLWTVIHGSIMSTIKDEDLSNSNIQSYFQSIILIYNFVLYYYNQSQKEQIRTYTQSFIVKRLASPPYIYQYKSIIAEHQNIPENEHKITIKQLELELEHLQNTENQENTPILSQFIGIDGERYLALTKQIPIILFEQIEKTTTSLQMDFRKTMLDSFYAQSKGNQDQNSQMVEHMVEEQLRQKNPLLYGLLNYSTVQKAMKYISQDTSYPQDENSTGTSGNSRYDFLVSLLEQDKNTLIPYTKIFAIDMAKIKKEAYFLLPFWMKIPGVLFIASLFRGITSVFKRKSFISPIQNKKTHQTNSVKQSERKKYSSSKPVKSSILGYEQNTNTQKDTIPEDQEYDAIQQIQTNIGDKDSARNRLHQLVNEWNTLLPGKERENLIKDVNSLCQDTLRSIWTRNMSQIPTVERIQEITSRISNNRVFQHIKKKNELKEYMEIYVSLIILQKLHKV